MTEYRYAKHLLCWSDLVWRRNANDDAVLWCPICDREVPREETSAPHGSLAASFLDDDDDDEDVR